MSLKNILIIVDDIDESINVYENSGMQTYKKVFENPTITVKEEGKNQNQVIHKNIVFADKIEVLIKVEDNQIKREVKIIKPRDFVSGYQWFNVAVKGDDRQNEYENTLGYIISYDNDEKSQSSLADIFKEIKNK